MDRTTSMVILLFVKMRSITACCTKDNKRVTPAAIHISGSVSIVGNGTIASTLFATVERVRHAVTGLTGDIQLVTTPTVAGYMHKM